MKSNRLTRLMLLALFTTGTIPEPLVAQEQQEHNKKLLRYRVIDLGTLGGTISDALGVSNRGWVAGWSYLPGDANLHALLWRKGVKTDLGTLGGPNSQEQWPVKDNRGLIVGSAETSAMDPFAEDFCGFDANSGVPPTGLVCVGFLWQDGVMTALPTLGGNNAQADAVNNLGEVAGLAETATQDPSCTPPRKSLTLMLLSGGRSRVRFASFLRFPVTFRRGQPASTITIKSSAFLGTVFPPISTSPTCCRSTA
jgi:probable HAF family extracellular repeat protein